MSQDDAHLCFLARSLEPNRWAGEAPLPALDVEGALAAVLARANAEEEAPTLLVTGPAPLLLAPPPRTGRRWTRALAAALLLVGGFAPWLASAERPNPSEPGAHAFLAGVSSAVVYSENSGSRNG